jgi:peptide-methionine (R)-S-oxide reductase
MKKLTKEQKNILDRKGTEAPFSGKYVKFDEKGDYYCVRCGNKLFSSENKFYSPCGWPSFREAIKGSVEFKKDFSHGMIRTEVLCSKCKGHLGHVFSEIVRKRYCINSAVLDFKK